MLGRGQFLVDDFDAHGHRTYRPLTDAKSRELIDGVEDRYRLRYCEMRLRTHSLSTAILRQYSDPSLENYRADFLDRYLQTFTPNVPNRDLERAPQQVTEPDDYDDSRSKGSGKGKPSQKGQRRAVTRDSVEFLKSFFHHVRGRMKKSTCCSSTRRSQKTGRHWRLILRRI